MESTSQKTTFKILPGQSAFSARIYFINGSIFRQRGDYLNPNEFLQLHDLKAWIKKALMRPNWKYSVWKIEIFDNTQKFENSRSLSIYRKIDTISGEIFPWSGSAKNERFVLFESPNIEILDRSAQ